MKNVRLTSIMLTLLVAALAQAVSLESIILGEAPGKDVMAKGILDPTSLNLSLTAGPDFDSPDNEYGISGGLRYNLFEIGPTVHFWPGNEDDKTTFGVYCLRHLTYDPVLLGAPFLGFDVTVAGSSGDMYAFVTGFDTEIPPKITLRNKLEYRSFSEALARSHKDESDEFFYNVSLVFTF